MIPTIINATNPRSIVGLIVVMNDEVPARVEDIETHEDGTCEVMLTRADEEVVVLDTTLPDLGEMLASDPDLGGCDCEMCSSLRV